MKEYLPRNRNFGKCPKKSEAEVQRPQDAKVIREVKYQVWLANTVPVKKKNVKWRMCVDFTDLNKACKKDDFPLERVDKIVDDAANNEMLSLLDMFSGYHQIRVRKKRRKNKLHHSLWNILFRENARGTEKRRVHIFENDSNSPPSSNPQKHLGIRGRYSRQECPKKRSHQ
jgi:hypothetical protein